MASVGTTSKRTTDGDTRRAFLTKSALLGSSTLFTGLFGGALGSAAAADGSDIAAFNLGDPPLRDADYWAFADWMQSGMDFLWSDKQGWYTDDTRLNATALATHSIAALTGHQGACRQDERARRIAIRLCQEPPYRPLKPGQSSGAGGPHSPSQSHRPGFVAKLGRPHSKQHIAIDSKIARGLYYAWRARRELQLPDRVADLIAHRVNAVAHSHFFRYPNIRLNQINFASELFACASSITGDGNLLRKDYRRHLDRFLRGARRPVNPWKTTNLSPSYSFHRNPFQRFDGPQNIESNEYANIVLDVISYFDQARQAGMKPLGREQMRTLRAWVKRALPAYWTHSGYMNWDTGLYLQRWHLTRYWAWSCQGILAIATSNEFANAEERAWAKYMFDRSFSLYKRICDERGPNHREPGSTMFGIRTTFSEAPHFELVRFQALAAEAVIRGLGGREATQPPALYAFDPQIGRLAVTTPTYNTAILATNNGALPYGGLDPVRLFDADQRVIAHIGARTPGGFGLNVHNRDGALVASSQTPRKRGSNVILNKSPRGRVTGSVRYPEHPYAGKFGALELTGHSRSNGIDFRTRHRFASDHIELSWIVTRSKRRRLSADAMFPTWGKGSIAAILGDGRAVAVESGPVKLDDVRYFFLTGSESGYVLVARAGAPGATALLKHPQAQRSNPNPGASLALRLAGADAWSKVSLVARVAPARDPQQAADVAARLGA